MEEEDVKELKEKDENLKKQIYQLEEEQKKINQKIQEIESSEPVGGPAEHKNPGGGERYDKEGDASHVVAHEER